MSIEIVMSTELKSMLSSIYLRYGKVEEPTNEELIKLLESLDSWIMLNPNYIDILQCYSNDKQFIKLTKFIKSSDDVKLCSGVLVNVNVNANVVVKYTNNNNIDNEIEYYVTLRELGCPLPWFSENFMYWRDRVLVIEKLDKITQYDDEYAIGIDVLKQLKFIHKFGCHSDIKPSNIMKKKEGKKTRYYLIDFGGMAVKKYENGYKRWTWTKNWSIQEPHAKNQVITYKEDLLELARTLRAIQNKRKTKKCEKGIDSTYIDNNYRGRLRRFVEVVKACNSLENIHDDLINILKNN